MTRTDLPAHPSPIGRGEGLLDDENRCSRLGLDRWWNENVFSFSS
jgi:hypothetical protein